MNMLSIWLFFPLGSLLLFLALLTSAVDVRQMSIDEYINFVNPPAVHKYQILISEDITKIKFLKGVDMRFCLFVRHEKGLEKPPKLKSSPLNISNTDSAHVNISEFFLKDECPEDTVALPEIKREEVERAGSVSQFLSRGRSYNVIPNVDPSQDGAVHEYATVRFKTEHNPYSTVSALMNVWRPTVASDAFLSIGQIWIANKNGDKRETIEVGWMVYPSKYRDTEPTEPRLFVYWTSDSYVNGCYNEECPGYVSLHNIARPGAIVLPASEFGGNQVDLRISVQKEVIENAGVAWSLYIANNRIGYWPASLFGALSLGSAATQLDVGGEVAYAPRSAGSAYTRTGMGSGRFPVSGIGYAAYFKKIALYGSDGQLIQSPELESWQTKPYCYQVYYVEFIGPNWGKTVFYGGPGGGDLNPRCVA